jgi:hypothetical protein
MIKLLIAAVLAFASWVVHPDAPPPGQCTTDAECGCTDDCLE